MEVEQEVSAYHPENHQKKAGWFDPLLSAILPYVIWIPYKVYSAVAGIGWRTLAKQLRVGSGVWEPSSPALSPRLFTSLRAASSLGPCLELLPGHPEFQEPDQPRRLTLLYTWLTSKPQHVQKYSRIFTERGIDVLRVQITAMDLLQPTSGSQVAAQRVVDFLLQNPQFDKILVYGFSVGAYAFSEAVKKIRDHPEQYSSVADRFVGHVWDSPVDLPNMPIGVAITTTSNVKMQQYITKYVEWFLEMRHEAATRHYQAAERHFYKGIVDAPGLFIYSLNDAMSPAHINKKVIGRWRDSGMTVVEKTFERAPHCASYSKFATEYRSVLTAFLHKIGFMDHVELRQSLAA